MDGAFEAAALFSLCYGIYIAAGLAGRRSSAALFFVAKHLFLLYLSALVLMTLLPAGKGGRGVNLKLFSDMLVTVQGAVRLRPGYLALSALNALLFVPFGFYAAALSRGGAARKAVTALLAALAASLAIELFQWLMPLGRIADVDDVFFNALGGLVGAILFLPFRKTAPRFFGYQEVL